MVLLLWTTAVAWKCRRRGHHGASASMRTHPGSASAGGGGATGGLGLSSDNGDFRDGDKECTSPAEEGHCI
eukprot:5121832-Lingulodinium_polyedra.AAC.1